MPKLVLKAEKRDILGRKVHRARKEGKLPGSVFGKDITSQSVFVDMGEFAGIFAEAGETQVVYVDLAGKEIPVLISDIQKHPVTGEYLNVCLKNINLKEKVEAHVPLEAIGEAPAVKAGLGTMIMLLDEIEVEALPTDIPDKIEVDISSLKDLESTVTVGDLKYDKTKLDVKTSPEEIVAKIAELQKEEEPVVAETPEGAEAAPAEGGEAPAQGQEAAATESEAKPEEGK